MHRVTLKAIIIILATTLLLAGCELISPPTPEESCLKTSIELVELNSDEEPDWPIKVTETSPITSDPVLCKGTAVFQDEGTYYIQFYENSNEIAFEGYVIQTCQELAEQVILMGSTKSDWPVKLEDLKQIDPEVGQRISCKSKAELGDGEKEYTAIYQRSDDNYVGFKRYQSTTCQELAEQVILMGATESDWPVKLENLIRIDEDPGERLTCKAHASYQDESITAKAIYEDVDRYVGFRQLPISERDCDIVLMRNIMTLTEELSMKSASNQTIIKIYDPKEISNTGDKLTCRGMAKFQAEEDSMIEFYAEEDKDGDRFIGFEGLE
jgi:hypothetical protein